MCSEVRCELLTVQLWLDQLWLDQLDHSGQMLIPGLNNALGPKNLCLKGEN